MSLAVLLLATTAAANVTVTLTPTKTEVTVGERFSVEVTAQGPAGTEFVFPGAVEEEKIELHPVASAHPRPDAHTYEGSVYSLSDVAIPALTVSYRLPDGTRGQAHTESVPLKVHSLLSRDPKEQHIEDIRPPVTVSVGRAFWIALALSLLALFAIAYFGWRRFGRPRPVVVPAAPPAPPDVLARAALGRLAQSGLIEREEFRAFYIALTEIAKRYLEAQLEAPILEMTTAETVAFLRTDPRRTVLADVMRDVTGAADRIKFARGQGARELAGSHLAAVGQLIDAIEAERRLEATTAAAK
jgi:hypothetical protein